MKRQTKLQKFNDFANAYHQIRRGEPVKRIGAKDGSIATHPVVSIANPQLERIVLIQCLEWLHKRHVFCQRHDSGSFQNERGQWGCYGIINSGDIHGVLRYDGQHFEIETKRGSGGRQSKGQQDRMRDVRNSNGLYFVVHGIEELEHYMGVKIFMGVNV